MKILRLFAIIFLVINLTVASVAAAGFTDKDRALLIRLDERLNQVDKRFEQVDKRFEELRNDMNKRFEQVDKRFEQVDKRFEQVDKRFEQVNKHFEQVDKRFEEMNRHFEQMLDIMLGVVAAFASIVAVTIGFAIWDRRTMVRPFEDKTRKMDEEILKDRKKINELLEVLRKYANEDKKLAEILKSFALL